jgi:hypothetical protein
VLLIAVAEQAHEQHHCTTAPERAHKTEQQRLFAAVHISVFALSMASTKIVAVFACHTTDL